MTRQVRNVVVDASACVEYVLRTRRSPVARSIIEAPESDLHTVSICDVEVCSAMRRAIRGNRISLARARQALDAYDDLPLTLYGHRWLMARILDLRQNFSAYDAAYVALAERLGAVLLTGDGPLANSVRDVLRLDVVAVDQDID